MIITSSKCCFCRIIPDLDIEDWYAPTDPTRRPAGRITGLLDVRDQIHVRLFASMRSHSPVFVAVFWAQAPPATVRETDRRSWRRAREINAASTLSAFLNCMRKLLPHRPARWRED